MFWVISVQTRAPLVSRLLQKGFLTFSLFVKKTTKTVADLVRVQGNVYQKDNNGVKGALNDCKPKSWKKLSLSNEMLCICLFFFLFLAFLYIKSKLLVVCVEVIALMTYAKVIFFRKIVSKML